MDTKWDLRPRTLIKALMEPLITLASGSGLPSERHQHNIPNALGSRESVDFPPTQLCRRVPRQIFSTWKMALIPLCKNSSFLSTLVHSPEFCWDWKEAWLYFLTPANKLQNIPSIYSGLLVNAGPLHNWWDSRKSAAHIWLWHPEDSWVETEITRTPGTQGMATMLL